MNAVWKYPIPVADYFEIEMPEGARPLSVQVQHDEPQMWCLVDLVRSNVRRRFHLAGTGHGIMEDADRLAFIGTLQLSNGGLVFHVFEVVEP